MQELSNIMRMHAEMVAQSNQNYVTVFGKIVNYDPKTYSAIVQLQPEGVMTGYLPVLTPWTGNGWGLYAPPSPGDQVVVQFQEGNISCGVICLNAFSQTEMPLSVNSGEYWLVHQTGSFFKLTNDGNISVYADESLNVNINSSNSGAVNITGNLNVSGSITSGAQITDYKTSMETIRLQYNEHTHDGGPTPEPQMST